MNTESTSQDVWPDGDGPVRAEPEADEGETLIVDVDGFEGPLDLLLELARTQKVDLARISILALAEQYLAFIETLRAKRLELAADYLVMAAWLAYLKSRLLIPAPPGSEEPPAEDLAARLAFRLQRLQAMRDAAAQLMARNRLGRDVFARGAPEPMVFETRREYADNLIDLLKAYAERRAEPSSGIETIRSGSSDLDDPGGAQRARTAGRRHGRLEQPRCLGWSTISPTRRCAAR